MLKLSLMMFGLMLILSKNVSAGEKSLYDFLWLDPDKKVYVLQNKLYKKEHSLYLDIGYASNYTSKFQDTSGISLNGGFYFHEEWGVELFYTKYSNKNNDEFKNIKSISNVEPFVRRPLSTYGAAIVWSPFYGKINTFNQIFYFDWSFAAGYAQVNTESNLETVQNPSIASSYESESMSGAILKTKVKFHATSNVHLGVEYMNTYYMAPGPRNPKSDKLRTNTDIIFSIGFSY